MFLTVMIGMWLLGSAWLTSGPDPIDYSSFKKHLRDNHIPEVTLRGDRIEGRLSTPGDTASTGRFLTHVPSFGDPGLLDLLEQHEVRVTTKPESESSFWVILLNVLPVLILVLIGLSFFQRMRTQGQGLFNIGRSRAKKYDRDASEETRFDDVAGAEGAKQELREIVSYLEDPSRFIEMGAKYPKGVLLVGPPGTGKTLLARAVAGEAGVPFLSITGSDFMEMFVGVGASRVRDMFKDARENAPSIIFIDELDSIGRRRGAGLGGGHDEREQTLNQMLSELDGFDKAEGVIVLAATNRPDILDPALLRPGRFDRRVTVDLPTLAQRKAILELHAKEKPMADDVDFELIAKGMPGSSGADLENVLNEAAMLAARKKKKKIAREDIDAARDKILLGLKRRGMVLTDEECRLVACHESGHALVAASLDHTDPVHKVSIVPRDKSMGVTQQLPTRDMYVVPRPYLIDRLAVTMGGRAAEQLVLGEISTGAENDLKECTRLARKMVLDWGMCPRLGQMSLGNGEDNVFLGESLARGRDYSEETAREIDEEIRKLLDEAYDRAQTTLEERREALDRLTEELLEHEELSGEEVGKILKN